MINIFITVGNLFYKAAGSPWYKGTGPPLPVYNHNIHILDILHASTRPGPRLRFRSVSYLTITFIHLEHKFIMYFLVTSCTLLQLGHLPLNSSCSSWHRVDHGDVVVDVPGLYNATGLLVADIRPRQDSEFNWNSSSSDGLSEVQRRSELYHNILLQQTK